MSHSFENSSSTYTTSRSGSVGSKYFPEDVSTPSERCQNNYPSKKVNITTQAGVTTNEQDDTLSKERKRWEKPGDIEPSPSKNVDSAMTHYSITSSESEEEVRPKISFKFKPTDFIFDSNNHQIKGCCCNKNHEGSSDQSSTLIGDTSELQRVPTPSSVSSTSFRPLEWDSGADVGYFQNYDGNELSSIEKIALTQGRGDILRNEPDGKSCSKKLLVNSTVLNMIGAPKSESTPVSDPSSKSNSKKKNKPEHLFPEVIIQVKGNQSDSNSDCIVESNSKCIKSDNVSVRRSTSLEIVNENKTTEKDNATFPRAHSNVCLSNDCENINPILRKISNPPPSVSSSSVATVVTGSPRKISKSIQTSNRKNNAATQSTKVEAAENLGQRKENSSSSQESAEGRVNSFEYLPGHMYEKASKSDSSSSWPRGISLREDVERGVHLLEEFIQGSNANNTLMKKELIERVVKKLIKTDYPEDFDSGNSVPLRCSTRRSQNKDQFPGDDSSANRQRHKKPAEHSSSLSGETSSPWASVGESTKSSEHTDDKKLNNLQDEKNLKPATEKSPKSSTEESSDLKSDWKVPLTKAEKLYENKRKGIKGSSEEKIIDFLNFERKNQLDWIVKEIDHLSNLKSLLEKHEKLRRNLQKLKHERLKKEGRIGNSGGTTSNQRTHFARRKAPTEFCGTKPSSAPSKSHHENKENEDQTWDSHGYDTSDRPKLKKSVSTETRKEDIYGNKRSTAYTIIFEPSFPSKEDANNPTIEKPPIADRQTLFKESRELVQKTYSMPTLQEALVSKRPELVARAEARRKTLAELGAVRELREERRPLLLAAALSAADLPAPPPPPLAKRVVSQKEMRRQTERKYRQTHEVKKKVSERKLKEKLKTNRLMADVYNKRLQLLTLKGHTDLSNSIDVISTV